MGADYIPERDGEAARWMRSLARGLVDHPELYRVSAEDAAEIEAAVVAFRAALARSLTPATRTRPAVSGKNDARKAAERLIRPMAQRIRTDTRIDAAAKVNIGLHPGGKRRRVVGPPASSPRLSLRATLDGWVTVKVSDSETGRRARPREAVGMELYVSVRPAAAARGEVPAGEAGAMTGESMAAWRFLGLFTATPFAVDPRAGGPGDEVTLMGRWVTRRGEPGAFGQAKAIRVSAVTRVKASTVGRVGRPHVRAA